MFAKTDALAHSVDVVRSEQSEGFRSVRNEVAAYAAQTRSEISGCKAHEIQQLSHLEALAITNRTLATRAVSQATLAVTLALMAFGAIGGLAFWIYEHITK